MLQSPPHCRTVSLLFELRGPGLSVRVAAVAYFVRAPLCMCACKCESTFITHSRLTSKWMRFGRRDSFDPKRIIKLRELVRELIKEKWGKSFWVFYPPKLCVYFLKPPNWPLTAHEPLLRNTIVKPWLGMSSQEVMKAFSTGSETWRSMTEHSLLHKHSWCNAVAKQAD